MLSVTLLASFAILGLLVARSVKSYLGLREFGGHWSAGWSRLWLLSAGSSGQMHHRFTDVNEKYGSTARIAPHMLVTTDPELMRRMNAVRSSFTRGPWYAALKIHPERENIVSHIDEKKHADLRLRMGHGYSGKENLHLEGDVDMKLQQFLQLIETKYVSQPEAGVYRKLDISRLSSFFTLDVISKIAFGHSFGFMDEDSDPFGYIENLESFLPAIIVFGVFTELTNLLRIPLLKAALPKSTDKRGLGQVMGFAKQRVEERFGEKAVKRQDMLNSFINRGLTEGELESETLVQITAGSDSTSTALRTTLHFISTSPPVLTRLLREFRHGIDAGQISRPIIQDAEARRLPYLQACIKEGLRMYPPVTGLMAKAVPAGGVEIDVDGKAKFVPEGTQIGWNSWGMMRNEEIFGPDRHIFRPERWLPRDNSEAEKQRLARMTDTVSLCFGYGRFGCLGRGLAIMELNKGIAETLIRFNLQPCSLINPFQELCVGFWIHKDMDFIVTRRGSAEGSDGDSLGDLSGMEVVALPGVEDV